jgi:serine/threonine protein kinase/tetratricopeptide (TPR) repeat protein
VNAAFGRYRLLERLGQGGMAEVFKAKSYGVEGFEKILVIKRILPELARSQEFVDMFIHEAKLAVRLSHANIVQVFDLGRASGEGARANEGNGSGNSDAPPPSRAAGPNDVPSPSDAYYMAMEYVHGLDLASVLARSRRLHALLPAQLGVYVASEVAKGLDHAHRRRDDQMRPLGIVHRDVSPQNVLLSFEGEVKVTDFGIAKARGVLDRPGHEETRARVLQGKFGYMSPEQARGDAVDARSDLFSLGTILYECVAGVNPFSSPTTFETLRRVQACEVPPIELLRPEVSPELVTILKTAMARSPGDRYPDAGRMYEALLAFLYAQGSRYGANELAEFLSRFRDSTDGAAGGAVREALLEHEAPNPRAERTPVEIPATRHGASGSVTSSARYVAVDRAVEMGERREVTGLVLELPRETPAAVVDKAASIIDRWGGRILRREAGHLAALFGLGDPDGRDTEMATRCALVALRSLDAARRPSAGLHIARIQVSRSGEPMEDERLGTLLDIARELARTREGQAAISTHAMRQVRALFEFEPLAETDQATNIASVLVKDVRGPGEAFGRFVGRKDELRRVGEVLAAATKRTARVLTIRGDNGVGKTRLLYEVERRLRKGGYNVGFHVAACPPRGTDYPLSGIVSMLQVLCGTAEGDANDRILAVRPRLRALGLQADEVHAVLTVLGANVPAAGRDGNAPLRQAFARMIQSLCEDRPHTFAWDVAHGMDEESFAMLEDVLRRMRQARLVLAFAARAGFTHPLEKTPNHVALDLGDLAPPEVERLIALRLEVDTVSDELLRFVRSRAGGHPLFVEEVIKGLVDAGAVTVSDRAVVSMNLVGQELALPKTLRGLVASRVARLANAERATLQAAAVLGDPIDVDVLANMLGEQMPLLERSIASLKERDFVADRGPSELRFTSPIVPEIVADALTSEAAREMHAAAGQALESTLGPRAWEQAARIAAHFYEAGDRARAATYFAKSGERRLETRQLEAAAKDYARAIALADTASRKPEELAAWLAGLAGAVRLVRSSAEAPDLCRRVLERVDQAAGREVRMRAYVAAGQILAAVQHLEDARRSVTEARSIAGTDPKLLAPVLIAATDLATNQGDLKRASELLDELERVIATVTDERDLHRVALHHALCRAAGGDRVAAIAKLGEAETLLPDDRVAGVERVKTRAMIDQLTGDGRSAVLHSEMAIDMSREMGLTYDVMLNFHLLGNALLNMDDAPRAYAAIRESLALCQEHGYERFANYNRMVLALLDGLQGSADAEKLLSQGIAYAESKSFTWEVLGGSVLLARWLHRRGRLDDARAEYKRARGLAVQAGIRRVVEDCDAMLRKLDGAHAELSSARRESAS